MIKAVMKNGREVYCILTEDINQGSLHVGVCWTELCDQFYNFTVMPEDYNKLYGDAVDEYIKKVVAELDEEDFWHGC